MEVRCQALGWSPVPGMRLGWMDASPAGVLRAVQRRGGARRAGVHRAVRGGGPAAGRGPAAALRHAAAVRAAAAAAGACHGLADPFAPHCDDSRSVERRRHKQRHGSEGVLSRTADMSPVGLTAVAYYAAAQALHTHCPELQISV